MNISRFLSCAIGAVLWLGAVGSAHAALFDINCGGATNVDTNPATIVSCNIGEIGTITDLDIYLNIDDATGNPYATDLKISLVHVATSTTVQFYLGPQVLNPTSVMDATFDDEASTALPGSGDVIGTFIPSELLSAFDGLELSGQWDLQILDDWTYPDEGIDLIEWRMIGSHVPEPGTGVLLAIGLVGLTVLSGRKRDTPSDSAPR